MTMTSKKRSEKAGLPPGTLIHIGAKKTEKTRISIFEYDESSFTEKQVESIKECLPLKEKPIITWINIHGIDQVKVIEEVGELFNLHPLLLEDIMNTEQRPKIDNYDNCIFIVLKALFYDTAKIEMKSEQVSLILGQNFVISLQEAEMNLFDPVRDRLKNAHWRIRKMGADYLAYSMIDTVVDSYFLILEQVGEVLEDLEDELVAKPNPHTLRKIHELKREMLFLRKSVWPLRELLTGLDRGETPFIHVSTLVYFRDVYDHTIQIIDNIETIRDMLASMLDIYLSSVSNRMNGIMKVLTIIATIFMPLTFMAGVYGMNFKHMPELEWTFGYPFVLIAMFIVSMSMLLYFKMKKWF